MTSIITKFASSQREAKTAPQLFDEWFDPIETEVRERARRFIEESIRRERDGHCHVNRENRRPKQ
jgi:putative transposase